jgi:hypothetical protein
MAELLRSENTRPHKKYSNRSMGLEKFSGTSKKSFSTESPISCRWGMKLQRPLSIADKLPRAKISTQRGA